MGTASFVEPHTFAGGGIYPIDISLTLDDTTLSEVTLTAMVSGVALQDGELQIIGTSQRDHVFVSRFCGTLFVTANVLPGTFHTVSFAYDAVNDIKIILGGGADNAIVAWNIERDTLIRGGAGSDRAAECFFVTIGSGGKLRFSDLVRRFIVGKEGAVCWLCVCSRIFIIALAFMASEARISFRIGFTGTGGGNRDRFTGGEGVRLVCNGGAGACDRLSCVRGGIAGGADSRIMVCGCWDGVGGGSV